MAEHTPGPWEQQGRLIFAPEAPAMICQLSEPEAQFVEHMPVGLGSPRWAEAMANGAIIKAAPALLRLCEGMIAVLEAVLLEYPDYADETDWSVLAEAQRVVADVKGAD